MSLQIEIIFRPSIYVLDVKICLKVSFPPIQEYNLWYVNVLDTKLSHPFFYLASSIIFSIIKKLGEIHIYKNIYIYIYKPV